MTIEKLAEWADIEAGCEQMVGEAFKEKVQRGVSNHHLRRAACLLAMAAVIRECRSWRSMAKDVAAEGVCVMLNSERPEADRLMGEIV